MWHAGIAKHDILGPSTHPRTENTLLIDGAGPKRRKLCRSGRKHTMPETRHIGGDLALPSVGRYQMKEDLQPADVTLHDAHLAATPTGSSVPCTSNDDAATKLIRCS